MNFEVLLNFKMGVLGECQLSHSKEEAPSGTVESRLAS